MCKVNKRICSGLLSLSLALGVSARKSDANFTGGTLRFIGGTIFWGTAAVCNILPVIGIVSSTGGEEKGIWAMGWFALNFVGLFGYIPGGILYGIGCLCDLGDNKKYDDADEKRRQAEEKRKQEEHEMQMALYRKKLEEK